MIGNLEGWRFRANRGRIETRKFTTIFRFIEFQMASQRVEGTQFSPVTKRQIFFFH